MVEVLTVVFWLLISFMVADYALGRGAVRDPIRLIVAAVFAVLFVVFVRTVGL